MFKLLNYLSILTHPNIPELKAWPCYSHSFLLLDIIVIMTIGSGNGYTIHGYCDRGIFIVNLDLKYWSIHSSIVRGRDGAVIRGVVGEVKGDASWEKHFIRVCKNLSQYPFIV